MEKDNFSVKNILLNIDKGNVKKCQDRFQENGKITSDSDKNEISDQATSENHKIHKPKAIRPLIGKGVKILELY